MTSKKAKKRVPKLVILFCSLFYLGIFVVLGCHFWVKRASAPFCTSDLTRLPDIPVGLLLGCSPRVGGRPNLFYTARIDAACELYHQGKIKAFILSGDNGHVSYDEPTAMLDDLKKRGIPESLLFRDYAGFRTLDSVFRAREVFGQSRFIVISQRFHNERAVFLARQKGIEAWGWDAADVNTFSGVRTHLREYLARVQAVLDVTLFQTRPKFTGPQEELPEMLFHAPSNP